MTPRGLVATVAAPAARRALQEGRTGAVAVVLSRGMYLRLGEADWVLLADPDATFGPLSMAVEGTSRMLQSHPAPRPDAPVRVSNLQLLIGDGVVSLERVRPRRCSALDSGPSRGPGGIAAATSVAAAATDVAAGVRVALAALPEPSPVLRAGIGHLAGGAVQTGVRALAGLGEGLTPAGDDVLAGYAAWCSLDRPVRVAALARGRSSPLGMAYIRAAEGGQLPEAAAALLIAIRGKSLRAIRPAARRLRTWGASSGGALGWGIAAGARSALSDAGHAVA